VLFHNFDRFLTVYESRFENEYGHFRPVVKEVVERYLDCGNPRSGFARIRCPDCQGEHLLTFSCKTRGFCPSCHAKRREEWGQWMRESLLLDVPHRQKVRKAGRVPVPLEMVEEELPRVPSKGWAEMIRKVYEVDPMICPRCGGRMRVVAFLTEYAVVDRIIRHLELTFVAEKPPLPMPSSKSP
jgi:ribosomal protein S27E